MSQQRVLHRWQRCELVGEYDIPGRLLCLLETVPSMAALSATKAASGDALRNIKVPPAFKYLVMPVPRKLWQKTRFSSPHARALACTSFQMPVWSGSKRPWGEQGQISEFGFKGKAWRLRLQVNRTLTTASSKQFLKLLKLVPQSLKFRT